LAGSMWYFFLKKSIAWGITSNMDPQIRVFFRNRVFPCVLPKKRFSQIVDFPNLENNRISQISEKNWKPEWEEF
jgi:hypothetical protein